VVLRHQLRNALLSFITRFGLAFRSCSPAPSDRDDLRLAGMDASPLTQFCRGIIARHRDRLDRERRRRRGESAADILLGIADPRLRVHADTDLVLTA